MITPPMGTAIEGYYEERNVAGVLDDLYASAICFDDGSRKAVLLTVDVCLLSTQQCNKYRAYISQLTGVDEKSVFINCSHTHTGPVMEEVNFAGQKGDPQYMEDFMKILGQTAKEALEDMCQAQLYYGEDVCEGISFCRRWRMKDGSVQTNPGVDNPDLDHVLAEPNPAVKVVKIVRTDGQQYVLVHFGTHVDTVGGDYVSADFPGFVRETVERTLDNTKCVFLTGVQGDVNHINVQPTAFDRVGLEYESFDGVPRGYDHAKHMGRKLGGRALGVVDKCVPLTADTISFDTLEVVMPSNQDNEKLPEAQKIVELYEQGRANELPYEKMELTTVVAEANRIVALKDGPESFSFVLSALKLGELTLACLPGECFTDIGRAIEAKVPSDRILVCCLTNGGGTYFPTSIAYDEGGYEARSSRLKKGGDKILVDGMCQLLSSM